MKVSIVSQPIECPTCHAGDVQANFETVALLKDGTREPLGSYCAGCLANVAFEITASMVNCELLIVGIVQVACG